MSTAKSGTRKSTAKPVVLFALLVAFSGLIGWRFWRDGQARGDEVALQGEIFGTTYVVLGYGENVADLEEELDQAIETELARVDALMSTYKPDSALSRFNAASQTTVFEADPSLGLVVAMAHEISAESEGAFDVTVKPLVDAWGFGAKGRTPNPPADLKGVMSHVGWEKVIVEEGGLRKTDPAVTIDLSAIAKGYAVDAVSDVLAAHGVERFMVEIGGEVYAKGESPRGPWRIGVERPQLENGRGVHTVVELVDLGMATSGDYRNYHEFEGKRVSHTIDARTGTPIDHALASVTVLHGSCAKADAYATAISVLGPEKGMALAERLDLAVLMLVRVPGTDPPEFTERASLAFGPHRAQD